MGTLTGNSPSLPGHCPHKLPTSCRLTATLLCCACQDKRPHSPTYSVYVDGVGFVPRGTRWEKYCWFCKTFWTHRIRDHRPYLTPSQSRIPDFPNQSEFLQRWFECHQGFCRVRQSDGSLQIIQLELRQPWSEVAPGCLPQDQNIDLEMVENSLPAQSSPNLALQYSSEESVLDLTISNLLSQARVEDQGANETVGNLIQTGSDLPEQLGNNTITDSRGLQLQDSRRTEAVTDNPSIQSAMSEAQIRLSQAQSRRDELAMDLEACEAELQAARGHQRQLQREHRAAENFARVFGTREEIESQEYTSPVAGMFTRAWERYGIAEEVRREERISRENSSRHQHALEYIDFPYQPPVNITNLLQQDDQYNANDVVHLQEQLLASGLWQPRDNSDNANISEEPLLTLDDSSGRRPPPMSDEDMTVKLICKICFSQGADTAVFPCGHLIMCEWCADVQIPTSPNDVTRPSQRTAQCPLCRKRVKHRFKVYVAN